MLRPVVWLPACAVLTAACAGSAGTTTASGAAAPPEEVLRGVEGSRRVFQHGEAVTADLRVAPAAVYAVLDSAYADAGLEVTTRVPRELRIASEGRRLMRLAGRRASAYVDCGSTISGPVADEAQVLITVTSAVSPGPGGGSVLTTRVDAEARARGTMEGYRDCASTGGIEELLLEQVRGRIGGSD